MIAKDISARLADRVEEVCFHLFPEGRRVGHEFCVGSISGERGDSLKVRLTSDKAGIWSDFATGEKGDLIDLWRLSKGVTLRDCLPDIRSWLGITETPQGLRTPPKKSYVRPKGSGEPVYGKALDYLKSRGITHETLKKFKIRSTDEAIVFPSFDLHGNLILEKTLKVDRKGKKEMWVSKDSEPILFGWQGFPDDVRSVCLCEGEIDCLTLSQLDVPALSVPFGAGSGAKHEWIEGEWERLSSFDEIFLCFDNDEEGKKAVADLVPRLGRDRCRVVTLPAKDPNDCFMRLIDITPYFQNAAYCHPEGLRSASEYLPGAFDILQGLRNSDKGEILPWCPKVKLRPSELTIWNGINGHGKSTLLNHLTVEFLSKNIPILYCSHEMMPERLLAQMIRQATGGDGNYSNERMKRLSFGIFSRLLIYTGKEDRLGAMRYAIRRYGVQHIIVDNLTRLCRMDDYSGQQMIVQDLADLKDEFSVHIHLVTHARKGESEKNRPDKHDVRGAGPITDIADNVLTIHRNKVKAEKMSGAPYEQRIQEDVHDAKLYVQKQRVDGWEGCIDLFFDPSSCQFGLEKGFYVKVYDSQNGF